MTLIIFLVDQSRSPVRVHRPGATFSGSAEDRNLTRRTRELRNFMKLIYFSQKLIENKKKCSIVTPDFLKNKTRLIICVPRKSTHMLE
jgi:hypothetical protein